MRVGDALKRIDAGWVHKPKGFRVRFDIIKNGQWETDYSPDESGEALDSDVTAWRLAWKMVQTCQSEPADLKEGDLANITVVDDQGKGIRSYLTGEYEVYRPLEHPPAVKETIGP
jgi:hypothetical protein